MAATERHVRRRSERPEPVTGPPKRRPVPGAVIDFANVSKRYPSGDTGLENVSFAIMPGELSISWAGMPLLSMPATPSRMRTLLA